MMIFLMMILMMMMMIFFYDDVVIMMMMCALNPILWQLIAARININSGTDCELIFYSV